MLAAWLVLSLNIITQWKKIELSSGKTLRNFLSILYLVSIAGIIISMSSSKE